MVSCSTAKKKDAESSSSQSQPAAKLVAEKDAHVKSSKKKTKEAAVAASDSKAASAHASGGALHCKSGSDERMLEVVAEGPGCKMMYTKGGEASSVATAKSGTTHCQEVFDRIHNKLQGAGYTCQ